MDKGLTQVEHGYRVNTGRTWIEGWHGKKMDIGLTQVEHGYRVNTGRTWKKG